MSFGSDAVTHFINQQILDALEVLDPSAVHSPLAISVHGRLKVYQDGTTEWYWKDKLGLVIFNKGFDSSTGELFLEAVHVYSDTSVKYS